MYSPPLSITNNIISEGSILNTKMDIFTFSEKEDMINFIEENNGTFIDFEL